MAGLRKTSVAYWLWALQEAEEKRQVAEVTAALVSEVTEGRRPQGRGLAVAVGRRNDFFQLLSSPP